jgi:hypothetical protein
MHVKVILLIAVGLVLIILSATGTLYFVQQAKQQVATVRTQLDAYGDRVSVPVPARKIARGEAVHLADFTMIEVPKAYLPHGVLDYLPQLPKTETAQYVALAELEPGHIMLPGDLAVASDPQQAIELRVDGGTMTLIAPVNLAEQAGQLAPGAHVDAFWRRDVGGGATETRLLGEGLRLRSFLRTEGEPKKWIGAEPAEASAVMVEADPEVIVRLIQTKGTGDLFIVRSGGVMRGASGEIVVGNAELRALGLVACNAAAGADAATTQPADLSETLRRAMDAGGQEKELCSLAVVRQATRSFIQVPCE